MIKIRVVFLLILFSANTYCQTNVLVTGEVLSLVDSSVVTAATVTGPNLIEVVNDKGVFVLEIEKELPFEIIIEAIGYVKKTYLITDKETELSIWLEEEITSLDAIVLSASRTPERVFESSVSIERMGASSVENTTSSSFYDGLENLKGVDVNTSSLTFKTINTRGFSKFDNGRFIQLVDGMDNASPGLNFSFGNLIGLNELDVNSVELLPGASSALYGANAFNGIMFMKSKSPFTHSGVSFYGKSGVTKSESNGVNEFLDVGVRIAKKVNDAFALKFTASFLTATDWSATNTSNNNEDGKIVAGDRDSAIDYNGINVYGDEFTNPSDVGFGKVSRTGYLEQSLLDADTDSFRAGLALHWRPLKTKDIEVILASKFGTGNTIYQGASRYALRNFMLHQHKLEIKTKHLVLRSYTTIEDAGDSYDITFAGINTLRAVNKSANDYNTANETNLSVDELWYGAYANALAGGVSGVSGGDVVSARKFADNSFRTDPTSTEFKNIFNKVIKDSDVATGAKFVDRSKLFHTDVNYNFKELIKFAEVQIGGSTRRYVLNSEGTLFTDTKEGSIVYQEFGVYTQFQKKILKDRLKLTGSIRYDKSQNFNGNFSPRASLSFSVDPQKKHNIRASVQTGFRNPTTQDQYVGLNIGRATLVGSAKDNLDRYTRVLDNSSTGAFITGNTTHEFVGRQAYENSFTLSSAQEFGEFAANGDFVSAVGSLKKSEIDLVKPEHVTSYEVGYRGKLSKRTILDVSTYYNKYKDFISLVTVLAPNYGNVNLSDVTTLSSVTLPTAAWALINDDRTAVVTYTNTDVDVASYGVNMGLETKIFNEYDFGINYTFTKQEFNQSDDPDFETSFNTPEHKIKVSLGNVDLYKGLGFGLNVRWQDRFYWESMFVDAMIDARTIVDMQINYKIKKWNSKLKIGGVNIFENEYVSAPGSSVVGSQLYGSITCNF